MTSKFENDAEKDPGDLEREVEQTRSAVEDTLARLIERFSPQQILSQVFSSEGGGDLSRSMVNMVRSNPMPALLTATGLAWMLMGQSRQSARQPGHGSDLDSPSHASYGVDPDYDPHSGEGHVALGKGNGAGHRGRDQAEAARQKAQQFGHEAEQGIDRMLREQPLAVGAIGIALGALAGALFPASRQEDELFGKYREQLMNKASGVARQTYAKADEVGRRMGDELSRDARTGDRPKTRH
ncbi:DUF3618 domain-containing protein [Gilvimarinus sp. F26214L]|uniref:DUF3618 domain-containing protein n=1 Tax=Gilvimarinus sp. DZF01 TaxID=3461371 RepID=UPI0040462A26